MSEPAEDSMAAGQSNQPPPNPVSYRPWARNCALLCDGLGGYILGGKSLGVPTDIDSRFYASKRRHANPWIGFDLTFPLGSSNEDDGFGVCHGGKYRSVARPTIYQTIGANTI